MPSEQPIDPIKELLDSLKASGKLTGKRRNRTSTIRKPTCQERSLLTVHPLLAHEWHPTKNGELRPQDVSYATKQNVWWQCPNNPAHEWNETVLKRHYGARCPFCPKDTSLTHKKPLFMAFPNLACEWHPTKNNNVNPNDVTQGSEQKIWWLCKNNAAHEWEARICDRVRGKQCPYCSQRKILPDECLAIASPELANELHPHRNGSLNAHTLHIKRATPVWWQCPNNPNHIWRGSIKSRFFDKHTCPFCLYGNQRKADINKSMAVVDPERASLWHPTKNGDLTPEQVTMTNSNPKYVWWLCPNDASHEWRATVTSPHLCCPHCTNLRFLYPNIANEFHPWKNHPRNVDEITVHSKQVFWWRCQKKSSHVWRSSLQKRLTDHRCPDCLKEEKEKS